MLHKGFLCIIIIIYSFNIQSDTQWNAYKYGRLLQESNLTAKQSHRAPHHVIQATTSEGLAQGPYVAAKGGFEPVIFPLTEIGIRSKIIRFR